MRKPLLATTGIFFIFLLIWLTFNDRKVEYLVPFENPPLYPVKVPPGVDNSIDFLFGPPWLLSREELTWVNAYSVKFPQGHRATNRRPQINQTITVFQRSERSRKKHICYGGKPGKQINRKAKNNTLTICMRSTTSRKLYEFWNTVDFESDMSKIEWMKDSDFAKTYNWRAKAGKPIN